ncbi:serotriflin-like [Varanus komodoensis]|uniref:serotriflin-like n=1 Tax=Varanus komodoensis TaxID=61221 RepID=UPI001CF7DFF1|nr:serotriflin-like [Varanus komodoensis]
MNVLSAVLSLAALLQPSPRRIYTAQLADGSASSAEQQQIVDKHNDLRRGVTPPASNMLKMEWNTIAAENAKNWAKQCTLSHSPRMKRVVKGIVCGENLFMSTVATPWPAVIQSWYNEEKYFKHGVGPVPQDAETGHYTQIVWYKSYQVGCYGTYCPSAGFSYYYVCHYCPVGNIHDLLKTPYKAGPSCGSCPSACDNGLCTNPCRYEDKDPDCNHLATESGCASLRVKQTCPASCLCTTEIK